MKVGFYVIEVLLVLLDYLCNWAISWLMSSSSLMPVNSPEPTELELSCIDRVKHKKGGRQDGEVNLFCFF